MRRLAACMVVMAACSAASAAPSVLVTTDDGRNVPLAHTAGEYSYEAEDLTGEAAIITLGAVKPSSISHQFTLQSAIGNEGPWDDLPGISGNSPWRMIPVTLKDGAVVITLRMADDNDYSLRRDSEVKINAGAQQIMQAAKELSTKAQGSNATLWPEIAKTCTRPDVGACYTYRSVDRFTFQGADGEFYRLRISHLGGC